MAQRVYDFMPQSDGWDVLLDGRLMASYPSLHLAVTAVKSGTHGKITDGTRLVLRRLGADGALRDLATNQKTPVAPQAYVY